MLMPYNIMQYTSSEPPYRWYMLVLSALTHTFTVAIPVMCLPVLFDEIAAELQLNLVQIGTIWGLASFPALFTSLIGGALSDRFGTRRTLVLGCTVVGVTGALRGLAPNGIVLGVTVFLFGLVRPIIPMTVHKTCGVWFSSRQLGVANGVASMGMALGFMLGSMFSATVLSPWLGGWRNVLLVYGGISIVFSLPWYLSRTHPADTKPSDGSHQSGAFMRSIRHVGSIRNVWLLGIALLAIGGSIQGLLGYLPLYLRAEGWNAASADGALATFHAVSMAGAIPFAFWSDRLRSRRRALLLATLFTISGSILLVFSHGFMVWVAVIAAGCIRDGFMAVFITLIIEIKEIGAAYAGTAIGFVLSFIGLGNLLAPPMGNSLAALHPGAPFLFWAGLACAGFFSLYAVTED